MPERSTPRSTDALIIGGILAFVVSGLLLTGLFLAPRWDVYLKGAWFHFQVVSFTSFVALVLALLVTLLTGSVAGVRTLFSTLALTAIAGIFLVHGLSTPGVLILTANPAVVWSAPISLFVGAVLFTLARWPWPAWMKQWIVKHRRHIGAVAGAGYLSYVVIAFMSPSPLQVFSRLTPVSTYAFGFATIFLYSYTAYHFWHDYRQDGRQSDATTAIALIFLAEAVVPMVWLPLWNLSWWIYHVCMLVAFSLATAGVVREYERARHFHLTYYFGAIGAIVGALLAWIAGNLMAHSLAPFVPANEVRLLRFTTSAIFAGMAFILFVVLLLIVRRGDQLLARRTAELQQQQVALERSRMAGALASIGLAIGSTLDLDRVLDLICVESMELFNADAAYLWLRDDDTLVGRAGRGHKHEAFLDIRSSVHDEELLGARIVRNGKPIYVNHAQTSDTVKQELIETFDIQSLMGVPLLHDDNALGALMLIDTRNPQCFDQLDIEVATVFGQQAAMALTHAHLYERTQEQAQALADALKDLRTSYQATLHALSAALDARDRETEGHSQRVRAYALKLADAMSVNDTETREAIEWGALLHDVGKIGIPDAILHKAGPLSDDEWERMRQHPEIGHSILSGISFLEPALPVVLYHHERWDGDGYPSGKQGEDIPLPARIFSVADTLDAITSARPYRAAQTFAEAQAEILRVRGTQFDPAVVDAFETIPPSTWRRLARQHASVEAVSLVTSTSESVKMAI